MQRLWLGVGTVLISCSKLMACVCVSISLGECLFICIIAPKYLNTTVQFVKWCVICECSCSSPLRCVYTSSFDLFGTNSF